MTLHQLRRIQQLPVPFEKAWSFLSDPSNLAAITPPSMGFKTLSGDGRGMYPGQIIAYEITPLFGIGMSWVTEITHVGESGYFVDEQRIGPYAFWHHKHFLAEIDGGVEMEDLLHYAMPFGFAGNLAHRLVRKKLDGIFEYRQKRLTEIFGAWEK
jgi:ligand-binding SRPBCC domain-containing protein